MRSHNTSSGAFQQKLPAFLIVDEFLLHSCPIKQVVFAVEAQTQRIIFYVMLSPFVVTMLRIIFTGMYEAVSGQLTCQWFLKHCFQNTKNVLTIILFMLMYLQHDETKEHVPLESTTIWDKQGRYMLAKRFVD